MTQVSTGMPRAKSENDTQIALKLPADWLARADALIAWVSRPGMGTTRTDVVRAAFVRGLEALEAERAADTKAKKSAKSK
ncbi:MAG: hypothetical protein ACHREM_24975 [Polyangiales bacterium]